jgi:endonuclease/exonuclease/phosphatase family metal-dependent hydrolase
VRRRPARSRRRAVARAVRLLAAIGGAAALVAWIVHERTPGLPRAGPAEGTLRVVTYNIRAGLGGLEAIAADLVPWDADVIALQEVERGIGRSRSADQPGDLGTALDMESAFAGSFAVGGGEHGLAILSRYPLSDVRTIPLPRGSGHWSRVALSARVETPVGPVRFVCVHLARPWRWPLSNTATRLAQLDALLAALENESLPVVLAGDFNSFPVSLEALSMARRYATSWSPWRDGWATSFPLRAIGWPAGAVKIDHVFHDRDWESTGHWVAPAGASDHRPVIVDLRPGEASPAGDEGGR